MSVRKVEVVLSVGTLANVIAPATVADSGKWSVVETSSELVILGQISLAFV
jgi:hypothetical protein